MDEEMVYQRAKQSVATSRRQITLGLTPGSHKHGLCKCSRRQ
jgi:hypothetical protein